MAYIDKMGVIRYALTKGELRQIYTWMEKLIADLPNEEYLAHQSAIKEVMTLIHQRERKAKVQ